MSKNINLFMKELADYINNHIVGTETTYIKKCNVSDIIRNRGHVIVMELIVPEDIENMNMSKAGPAFYAEELLNEFPHNTVAHIGEVLNARVTELYNYFINMLRSQFDVMKKSIDDYDRKDLILTAIPTSLYDNDKYEPIITKKDAELGLTLILKAALCEAENENQTYFTPIMKKDGHEDTKDHWTTAAKNSLMMSEFKIQLMPIIMPDGPTNFPVFGAISDTKEFYDFFYLLSPEDVWKGLKDNFGADKVYIIPDGAYSAIFIPDTSDIRKNIMAKTMAENLLKKGLKDLKDKPLSIFELNCSTFKITRYKGNGSL